MCLFRAQKRQTSAVLDYQAPRKADSKKSSVTLHNDKQLHFGQRSTPSLSGSSSSYDNSDSKPAAGFSGMAFKKRKINFDHRRNVRKRDEDD